MQEETVEVRRPEVLERSLERGANLRGYVRVGVVRQGLIPVLSTDRGVSGLGYSV